MICISLWLRYTNIWFWLFFTSFILKWLAFSGFIFFLCATFMYMNTQIHIRMICTKVCGFASDCLFIHFIVRFVYHTLTFDSTRFLLCHSFSLVHLRVCVCGTQMEFITFIVSILKSSVYWLFLWYIPLLLLVPLCMRLLKVYKTNSLFWETIKNQHQQRFKQSENGKLAHREGVVSELNVLQLRRWWW